MSEHDHDQMPMQLNAKVYLSKKEGPALAIASVNLNGCFALQECNWRVHGSLLPLHGGIQEGL